MPNLGGAGRRVILATLATMAGTVFLVAAVTIGAVQRVDGLAATSQERLLRSFLRENIDKIPYDQESVAIWDDAIDNLRTKFNKDWVDQNLGSWMSEYFKHDAVAIVDSANTLIYAHTQDDPSPQATIDISPAVQRLIKELRDRIARGALDLYEAEEARIPRVADRIVHRNRPAIVSLMPVVSDTGERKQERGSEYLLISYRYLDESFLTHLAENLHLVGARFSFLRNHGQNEWSLAITNEAGTTIGHLIWLPTPHGDAFLASMLPALILGFLAFALLIAILVHSLLVSYRRLKESEMCALHASRHDILTGLPNRGFFEERLSEAMSFRNGGPIALLFLDLDRFKQVNDTLGHPAGDILIQTFARRISKHIAADEFLARLGGDEFAIIVPHGGNQTRIEALCDAILTAAGTPFWISTTQAMVGASIGIAFSKPDEDAPSDLTRKADIALYQAKNAGRHRSACFSERSTAAMATRRQLEVELRAAIKSKQGLSVVFQPIYDTATGCITGAEALARWENPRVGSVAPPVFIDIAENCGLIEKLGAWILREACTVAVATGIRTISVNAAAAQFLDPSFAETVFAILAETGLPSHRLELELTERTLLDTSHTAKDTIHQLRRRGVKIALDDFGTGYSSLSYLLQHKVDRLKIDRSFISLIEAGGSAATVVLAIIAMAHTMEIAVTAEGVETAEQMALLKLLACDSLQGYHLSRPVSAAQLALQLDTTAIVA